MWPVIWHTQNDLLLYLCSIHSFVNHRRLFFALSISQSLMSNASLHSTINRLYFGPLSKPTLYTLIATLMLTTYAPLSRVCWPVSFPSPSPILKHLRRCSTRKWTWECGVVQGQWCGSEGGRRSISQYEVGDGRAIGWPNETPKVRISRVCVRPISWPSPSHLAQDMTSLQSCKAKLNETKKNYWNKKQANFILNKLFFVRTLRKSRGMGTKVCDHKEGEQWYPLPFFPFLSTLRGIPCPLLLPLPNRKKGHSTQEFQYKFGLVAYIIHCCSVLRFCNSQDRSITPRMLSPSPHPLTKTSSRLTSPPLHSARPRTASPTRPRTAPSSTRHSAIPASLPLVRPPQHGESKSTPPKY
jgi:hypothetical protein